MGFVAARWRAPKDMAHLDEWGLGGRSFGGWITWFLVGGDLYTAYTFVAVPALIFGAGAAGFFAVPYTVIIYPLFFLVLVRLWSVSHRHGFVTPADFVRSRFDSPTLALLIAITGIVATMPYIALQLVGIEAVLKTMGVTGDSALARHLPIIIAFAILAAYTYQSGLRAPALIAFVKDTLIYIVIIVAVIYLPYKLGGWGSIFDAADTKFQASPAPGRRHPAQRQQPAAVRHAGARLGAGAVPLPAQHHRRAGQQEPQRDQAEHVGAAGVQLPARPDRAARLHGHRGRGEAAARRQGRQRRQQHGRAAAVRPEVPGLVRRHRVRRDRHRRAGAGRDHVDRRGEPVHPQHLQGVPEAGRHPRRRRRRVSKIASLVVKVGAVAFIVFLDPQFSIDLQLIGGVIILQTAPAVALGPLHPLVPPGRPDRRLGGRHGPGHVDALADPERGHRAGCTSAARRSR